MDGPNKLSRHHLSLVLIHHAGVLLSACPSCVSASNTRTWDAGHRITNSYTTSPPEPASLKCRETETLLREECKLAASGGVARSGKKRRGEDGPEAEANSEMAPPVVSSSQSRAERSTDGSRARARSQGGRFEVAHRLTGCAARGARPEPRGGDELQSVYATGPRRPWDTRHRQGRPSRSAVRTSTSSWQSWKGSKRQEWRQEPLSWLRGQRP